MKVRVYAGVDERILSCQILAQLLNLLLQCTWCLSNWMQVGRIGGRTSFPYTKSPSISTAQKQASNAPLLYDMLFLKHTFLPKIYSWHPERAWRISFHSIGFHNHLGEDHSLRIFIFFTARNHYNFSNQVYHHSCNSPATPLPNFFLSHYLKRYYPRQQLYLNHLHQSGEHKFAHPASGSTSCKSSCS